MADPTASLESQAGYSGQFQKSPPPNYKPFFAFLAFFCGYSIFTAVSPPGFAAPFFRKTPTDGARSREQACPGER